MLRISRPRGASFDSVAATLRNGLECGAWLQGDAFSAANIPVGSGVRWGVNAKLLPDDAVFGGYVKRLESRPAWRRTLAIEAAG